MNLAKFETRFRSIIKAFLWISYASLLAMTLMVVIDVAGRFVFNKPLPATVDASELILPYLAFIPLAYTLATDAHIRLTLFTDRMPLSVQLGCKVFVSIIGFIFFTLLTIYGWFNFWNSFLIREQMAAPIYLPWYVGKLALPIGTALISIQFLILLAQALSPSSRKVRT